MRLCLRAHSGGADGSPEGCPRGLLVALPPELLRVAELARRLADRDGTAGPTEAAHPRLAVRGRLLDPTELLRCALRDGDVVDVLWERADEPSVEAQILAIVYSHGLRQGGLSRIFWKFPTDLRIPTLRIQKLTESKP